MNFKLSESSHNKIINITQVITPIGAMFAGATDDGICLLEFTDEKINEVKHLKKTFNTDVVFGDNRHFYNLEKQIMEYFKGARKIFDIPMVLFGTEFQLKVWNELVRIPYGSTCSYAEQAKKINHPKAVRAVANANGCNKIAIIIPCHRVIAKDGSLSGYRGGVWRKQYLLDLEMANN